MSSQEDALLIETLRTIRTRLDEIASLSLASYELSKDNEDNLRTHMKRSDALEANLKEMEKLVEAAMRPIQWFKMTGKVFAWVAGATGALVGIYKVLEYLG